MKNIDISIIVPVYNLESYIDRCIDSLINQRFKNIEIIIINDASTDKSKAKIMNYLNKHENIIFIDNSINKGVSRSRNNAISIARGQYILFVDGDDWIEKDMCFELYAEAKESNADIIMCDLFIDYDDKKTEVYNMKLDRNKIISSEDGLKEILTEINNVKGYSCNKLYKKSFLIENNIKYPEDIILYEDSVFNILAFSKATKIKYIDKPLYHYFQRNDSATKKFNEKNIKNAKVIIELVKQHLKDENKFEKFEEEYYSFSLRVVMNTIFNINKSDYNLREKSKLINQLIIECNMSDIISNSKKDLLYSNHYYYSKLLKLCNMNTYLFIIALNIIRIFIKYIR